MKTQLKKIIAIAALVLAIPFAAFSQDNMQPADVSDTGISPADAQMDSAEAAQVAPPDQAPVTTQTFYDGLTPYGQWVSMAPYGYVWIPNAGPGFVPYSNYGHWVYTEYGWTWVSDYSWGWAPFHYGRWGYDAGYGWYWIPDVHWGPAWVCWRHCDGYYGWAPLGWGMNITDGYYGDYGIAASWWIFVDEGHVCDRYVYRYYQPRNRCDYYYQHSTVVAYTHYDAGHHITYAAGPHRDDVARVTKAPVRQIAVHPSAKPEQRYDNQHLHIYKPEVKQPASNERQPAPQRPVQQNEVPKRTENPTTPIFRNTAPARSNPAPQQQQRSYSAPQRTYTAPQRSYSAPARSAPAPARSMGGGGGGGRKR